MLEMSRINGVLHPARVRGEVGTATGLLCLSILNTDCINLPKPETTHNLFFRDFQEASFITSACMEKESVNLC